MFKDVLLPVDLNDREGSLRACEVAVLEARSHGAELHVMTVVPDFGSSWVATFFPEGTEKRALESADKEIHAFTKEHLPGDLAIQHIVAHGNIYREILRVAGEIGADLIVMASHRPELQDYLLGANAAKVVRHARCSVMVVRPGG